MTTANEQDELIFDFLEGNLSPDETEAFMLLKEESELFNREVRLWQNAYIDEPLPSVKALEEKLLIKPNTHSGNFSTRIFTALIIMFMFTVIPEDRTMQSCSETFAIQRDAAKTINRQEQIKNFQRNLTFKENKIKFDQREKHHPVTAEVDQNEYQSVVFSERKPESLFKTKVLTLQKIEIIKIGNRKPPSNIAGKNWTSKEKRQIRKKRWHDIRTREAKKFLKGNVPYVVPLNSNNF